MLPYHSSQDRLIAPQLSPPPSFPPVSLPPTKGASFAHPGLPISTPRACHGSAMDMRAQCFSAEDSGMSGESDVDDDDNDELDDEDDDDADNHDTNPAHGTTLLPDLHQADTKRALDTRHRPLASTTEPLLRTSANMMPQWRSGIPSLSKPETAKVDRGPFSFTAVPAAPNAAQNNLTEIKTEEEPCSAARPDSATTMLGQPPVLQVHVPAAVPNAQPQTTLTPTPLATAVSSAPTARPAASQSLPPPSLPSPTVAPPRTDIISPKAAKKRKVGEGESPSRLSKVHSAASRHNGRALPLMPSSLGVTHPPIPSTVSTSTSSTTGLQDATSRDVESLILQLYRSTAARLQKIEEHCAVPAQESTLQPACKDLHMHLMRMSELSVREARLLITQQQCFRLLKNLNLCFPTWGAHETSYLWHSSVILESTTIKQISAYALMFDDLEHDVVLRLKETKDLAASMSSKETEATAKPSLDHADNHKQPELPHSMSLMLAEIQPGLLSALVAQVNPYIMTQCLLHLDNFRRQHDSSFQPLEDLHPVLSTYLAAQCLHTAQQPPLSFVLGSLTRFKSYADLSCVSSSARGMKRKSAVSQGQVSPAVNNKASRVKRTMSVKTAPTAETDQTDGGTLSGSTCRGKQSTKTTMADHAMVTQSALEAESTLEVGVLPDAAKGIQSSWSESRLDPKQLPVSHHHDDDSYDSEGRLSSNEGRSTQQANNVETPLTDGVLVAPPNPPPVMPHHVPGSGGTLMQRPSSPSIGTTACAQKTPAQNQIPTSLESAESIASTTAASVESYMSLELGTRRSRISPEGGEHGLGAHTSTTQAGGGSAALVLPAGNTTPLGTSTASPQSATAVPPDMFELPRDPEAFRSQVKGVYYDDTSNRWCASWHERKTGKKRSRYFAVKKFGFTTAKTHAMDARLEAEESGECAPTNIN